MQKKFKFKNDKYRKVRGGTSILLIINCAKCNRGLAVYQKDGPGHLVRCYFNRFFSPHNLVNLGIDDAFGNLKKPDSWVCEECNNLIGTPMLYRDGRYAFRLQRGAIQKTKLDPKDLLDQLENSAFHIN